MATSNKTKILISKYEHVTDKLVVAWKGGTTPTQLPEMFSTKAAQFKSSEANREWQRMCYELCARVAVGDIKPTSAAQLISGLKIAGEVFETIADATWTISLQVEDGQGSDQGKAWDALGEFVRNLTKLCESTQSVFEKLLSPELLYAAGLINSVEGMEKKLKKINTDAVYRQQKYNLLREETEGYAKIVVVLGTMTLGDVSQGLRSMRSLIGYFDLDPNRVLSLCLDAFECDPANNVYPVVLSHFKRAYLPQLLGFKLQHFSGKPTPKSLFRLTASLLDHNLISLDEVLPHLTPSLESIADLGLKRREVTRASIAAIGFVNLNESSANAQTSSEKFTIPSFDLAGQEEDEAREDVNQVLGLLEHLVIIGAWTAAAHLVKVLEAADCYDIATHGPLREALCGYLHALVEPLYSIVSPRGQGVVLASQGPSDSLDEEAWAVKRLASFEAVNSAAFLEPLRFLGSGLSYDVMLFAKICRITKHCMATESLNHTVHDILSCSLLPCCSIIKTNPSLVMELWDILEKIPVGLRAQLYESWLSGKALDDAELGSTMVAVGGFGSETRPRCLEVVKSEAEANHEMKQLLKRISSDKKKLKQDQRLVARIAHTCPLIAADRMLSIAVTYDNQIAPLVECVAFFSPLALDVTAFMMVRLLKSDRMGAGKKSAKFQGGLSDWFRNMSTFVGAFYQQNPAVEVTTMLGYVVEQLNAGSTEELLILREVLTRVGGIEQMEQVNEEQVAAFAGGDLLRKETTASLTKGSRKKGSQQHLRESLLGGTGLPLMVLTAQMRNVSIYHGDEAELKLVGDLLDRCLGVLSQLVDFLGKKKEQYATLLPSLTSLCAMSLAPEICFLLARPLIRAAFDVKAMGLVGGVEVLVNRDTNKASLITRKTAQETSDGDAMVDDEEATSPKQSGSIAGWCVQSASFKKEILDVLPPDVWEHMSLHLYTCFWGMSLPDIHVPSSLYKTKISELHKLADKTRREQGKKEARLLDKRCEELKLELEEQEAAVLNTLKVLKSSNEHLFSDTSSVSTTEDVDSSGDKEDFKGNRKAKVDLQSQSLIQHCVLPRMLLSESDAIYCARFIMLLHETDTPYFSSLQCFNYVVKTVVPIVSCISEREATNLGLFLQTFFEPLVRWLGNRILYQKEAESRRGFALIAGKLNSSKMATFQQFSNVFSSWHSKIVETLIRCLSSASKFEQRSGLNVLVKIIHFFPMYPAGYELFVAKLGELSIKEGAGPPSDINTVAMTLKAQLQKRESSLAKDPSAKKKKNPNPVHDDDKKSSLDTKPHIEESDEKVISERSSSKSSKSSNQGDTKSLSKASSSSSIHREAPYKSTKFTDKPQHTEGGGTSKDKGRKRDRDHDSEKPAKEEADKSETKKMPREDHKSGDTKKRDRQQEISEVEKVTDAAPSNKSSRRDHHEKRVRGDVSPPPSEERQLSDSKVVANRNRGGNGGGESNGGGGGKGGKGGRGGYGYSRRGGGKGNFHN